VRTRRPRRARLLAVLVLLIFAAGLRIFVPRVLDTLAPAPRLLPPPASGSTKETSKPKPSAKPKPLPASALIQVPPQSQYPQLPNGCEVTSLSMLLTAVGHPVNKMTLSRMIAYDPTPRVEDAQGRTVSWGNPNVGFVGSMTVWQNGFGVYHGPVTALLNKILPGRAVDMTGKPVSALLRQVADGIPVEIWVTTTLKPTNLWVTWQSPEGPVRTTYDEHAVLLVGYNKTDLFINNPLNGEGAQAVPRQDLLGAWYQMGEQAVSVGP